MLVSQTQSGPDHLLPWSDGAMIFGSTQSYSIGLHLKGHQVLSDFSFLEKLRQWHYKNNNMLRGGRGWRIKWVERWEWDNNNNKLSW